MKKEFYQLNVGEKFTGSGTEYMAIKTISTYPGGASNTYNCVAISGKYAGQLFYIQMSDNVDVEVQDEK